MSRFGFTRTKGFTLVEVLVSTIILAIGLLGLASMQTLALKDNQDAFLFAQAASLAYEMSDRIKANSPTIAPPWENATLPTPATSCTNTDNCNTTTGCDSATMAAYDYCAWEKNAKDRIGSSATTLVSRTAGGNCSGAANKLCLTVSWTNNNQKMAASNSFKLEIQP